MTADRTIVIASAGSGKTYTLANLLIAWMIDRLRTEGDPGCDRFLASTFTRKAAGEILDRVLEHLARGVLDPAACARYGPSMRLDPEPTSEEFAVVLKAVAGSIHRVQVGTLDGFFHRIASCFSSELGLPEHWTVATQFEEDALHMQSLSTLLASPEGKNVGALLEMLQRGKKSRSIIDVVEKRVWGRDGAIDQYRLTRLLEDQYAAWSWLRPPSSTESLDGGRPHPEEDRLSLIEAMEDVSLPLTKQGHENKVFKTGWIRIRGLAASEQWEDFLCDSFVQKACFGDGVFNRISVDEEMLELIAPLVEHARFETIRMLDRQLVSALGLLELLEQHYRSIQEQHGLFSFADISQRLAEAGLVRRNTLEHLWFRLDGSVRDLALDEFQDTSRAQFDVLHPIIEEILSGQGSEEDRGFLVLADPKQSIYAWRGGTPSLIDLLERRHAAQLEPSVPLTRSWRSAQVVLDAVDTVFAGIGGNPTLHDDKIPATALEGAEAWAARYEPHQAARTLPGYVEVVVPDIDVGIEPTQNHALDAAVDLVVRRQKEDPGRTIGILTSRNKAVTRIVTMLRNRGVEASEEGSSALTDSLAVGAVLSMLHLADHPGDFRSYFHVATTPLGSLLQLDPIPSGRDRSNWTAAARSASLDIRRRLSKLGYANFLQEAADRLLPSCNHTDVRRLGHLVELGETWDARDGGRPADFVRMVERSTRGSVASSSVQVMTIHKAKGLEFDEVVLPELGRKLVDDPGGFFSWSEHPTDLPSRVVPPIKKPLRVAWPTIRDECYGAWSRQQIQESLSVLYVAMTRARHALHLVLRPHSETKKGDSKNMMTHEGLVRGAFDGLDEAMMDHCERRNTTVWSSGDADWFRSVEPNDEIAPVEPPRRPEIVIGSEQSTRRPSIKAPSQHASDGTIDSLVGDAGADFAMLRGTVMHEFLSLVDWIEDGRPDATRIDDMIRRITMDIGRPIPEDVLASGLQAGIDALDHESIASRLSHSAYADRDHDAIVVRNEASYIARTGGGESRGRFDRIVLGMKSDRVVWIDLVDYKSDTCTSETAGDVLETHRGQLEGYRDALASIHHIDADKITLRLLLTGPGIDIELPVDRNV